MANRLATKLNTMVAHNQRAFIKGRCIHDNFLLVQNMAKLMHKQSSPRVMFKLDITKVFDSVSWLFMLEILTHLGFGSRWRMMLCNMLSSSSTRVLLNGVSGDYIQHRRGLWQGDPLSPHVVHPSHGCPYLASVGGREQRPTQAVGLETTRSTSLPLRGWRRIVLIL